MKEDTANRIAQSLENLVASMNCIEGSITLLNERLYSLDDINNNISGMNSNMYMVSTYLQQNNETMAKLMEKIEKNGVWI